MSEIYERFARDTYKSVYDAIEKSLPSSGKKPLLVISTGHNYDSEREEFLKTITPDKYEEPAFAAAYTHISAIRAASDLAGGKDKVIVGISTDDVTLKIKINQLSGQYADIYEKTPEDAAIRYSLKHGYKLIATDPLTPFGLDNNGKPTFGTDKERPVVSDERFNAQFEKLEQIAHAAPNSPKIVIHIAHSESLGIYQGNSFAAIREKNGDLAQNIETAPLKDAYGTPVFFNSGRMSEFKLAGDSPLPESRYYENPKNAIQIDAPGQMDQGNWFFKGDDHDFVGKRIEEIADEYRAQKLGCTMPSNELSIAKPK